MESLPYSGTSKRAKAPAGNIAQTAHCLVDGCTADLNLCRDYHRRHKVCEAHSKTPLVKISGREQRFCQQCSRFHSLVEFDEGKRSCRKRLDGHNRRRRKPQPDSRTAPPGLIFSAQQSMPTARLLSFTSPQMLPTAVGNSWPGIVKPEHEMSMPSYNNHHHYQQLNYVERPGQFSDHAFHEHAFVDPTPSASPNIVSGISSGSNGDCALSLLSSSAPSSTREFVLNNVVAVQTGTESVLPPHHALLHNYYGGGSTTPTAGTGHYAAYFQEIKPVPSASDSHGSNTSTVHFPEMFQPAPEGSSTGGSHQTLTFTWE